MESLPMDIFPCNLPIKVGVHEMELNTKTYYAQISAADSREEMFAEMQSILGLWTDMGSDGALYCGHTQRVHDGVLYITVTGAPTTQGMYAAYARYMLVGCGRSEATALAFKESMGKGDAHVPDAWNRHVLAWGTEVLEIWLNHKE